jgi:hypothetical protein
MVGTMVNVGQAINRRIALQIAADAGAWTGATNMAIGMNALAEVNDWRHDIEDATEAGLIITGPIPYLELDEVVKTVWRIATAIVDTVDLGVNMGYAKIPYDEAARVTFYNNQDLFPGEQLQWYEGYRPVVFDGRDDVMSEEMPIIKSRETVCWTQPFPFVKFPLAPCLIDEDPVDKTFTYLGTCYATFVAYPCPETFDHTYWWEKSDFETVFVWVVEAPETRAIFNPFDVFGDDAIPLMRAAAAAKPVGGSIVEGKDDYAAKMVSLGKTQRPLSIAQGGGIYDPIFDKVRPLGY